MSVARVLCVAALTAGIGMGLTTASTAQAVPASAVRAEGDIVATAVGAGKFSVLAKALEAAGLVGALQGEGPFTVFAPTDEAFERLGGDKVEVLLRPENRQRLADILKFHVVAGRVDARTFAGVTQAASLDGQRLVPSIEDGQLRVNGTRIVAADVGASNGVIHVIDRVLIPARENLVETAAGAKQFKTLIAAAKAAGLAETLSGEGPFTIFAPTDEAFAKLPAGTVEALLKPEGREMLRSILAYHVVPARVYAREAIGAGVATTVQGESVAIGYADGRLRVNGAGVIRTDLDASNGVIHVIDAVLIPGGAPNAARAVMPSGPEGIIALAIERGAPLFNEGQQGACAAIYEVAVSALLAQPKSVIGAAARKALESAAAAAGRERDATEKAWILRRGLDGAAAALRGDDGH